MRSMQSLHSNRRSVPPRKGAYRCPSGVSAGCTRGNKEVPQSVRYSSTLQNSLGIPLTDGHDIMAILFVGGPAAGKFDFQIDDVRLG